MTGSEDPVSPQASSITFPFSSSLTLAFFGEEEKGIYIHSAFIKDDFFATSEDFPNHICIENISDKIKSGSLPHLSYDSGQTLIHFLCTGEYKLPDEVNEFNFTKKLEKLLKQNISNLFAAEMCYLPTLQKIIQTKIVKLSPSLNIFRSLQLVDSELSSNSIMERKEETTKSREWLTTHFKKQLKDSLEGSEKIFDEFNLSDFINKTSFLEDMGTELIRFMFDRMAIIQSELSETKKSEKDTKRMLEQSIAEKEEMTEKILMVEKQLKTENKNIIPCDASDKFDAISKLFERFNDCKMQDFETQELEYKDEQNLEDSAISRDFDDHSEVNI